MQLPNSEFTVSNKRSKLKLIPYIGCKSGFAHIFDALIPNVTGKICDVFGGGGGFTFYACDRFGSKNVIYNDHNQIIINLMNFLKSDPDGLCAEYEKHRKRSDADYYLKIRTRSLDDGVIGAGRFFYLAKNAFSGKIRFNSKNEFNSPMRKSAKCPRIDVDNIRDLSDKIKHLKITTKDFKYFKNRDDCFLYLDPPYMNNFNGHYNSVVSLEDFVSFVRSIEKNNKVMISEQNTPKYLKLSNGYVVYYIVLTRSLQYITQNNSKEIIAINYSVDSTGHV